MIRSFVTLVIVAQLVSGCIAEERYHNSTWNFCVDYPKGWTPEHPIDEYGIAFHRGDSISMSFGVIKDNENLEDNFRTAYLENGSVSVTERESTTFHGRPAIVATLAHDKPSHAVQHIMTVAASEGVIYEFQVSAPDQNTLNQFLPMFRSELASFKFSCK